MQTSPSVSTEEIFHTAYILVGLVADEVNLHEKDPRVRITEEFILYRPLRTDGDGPVAIVFQCTDPEYTLALEALDSLPPTVTLIADRVVLPLRAQLKIRVDLGGCSDIAAIEESQWCEKWPERENNWIRVLVGSSEMSTRIDHGKQHPIHSSIFL